MQELWKRFKQLTGFKGQDVADMTNTSRQHVSYLTTRDNDNISITHKSAVGFWMEVLIDKKIKSLNDEIIELKQLKCDLRDNIVGSMEREQDET